MNKKENDCFVKSSTPCVAPLVWEENCLFCGEKCDLQNDKKHPDGRYEDCRNKLLICEILGLPVPKRYMQSMKTESYLLLSNLFASNPSHVRTSLDLYDEYVHLG